MEKKIIIKHLKDLVFDKGGDQFTAVEKAIEIIESKNLVENEGVSDWDIQKIEAYCNNQIKHCEIQSKSNEGMKEYYKGRNEANQAILYLLSEIKESNKVPDQTSKTAKSIYDRWKEQEY